MVIADCCDLSVCRWTQSCNFGWTSQACWNLLLSHHALELWADLGSREQKLNSGNPCWGTVERCDRKQDTRAAIELVFKKIFEALMLNAGDAIGIKPQNQKSTAGFFRAALCADSQPHWSGEGAEHHCVLWSWDISAWLWDSLTVKCDL